ncbi:SDR family NAD(P)-dependent oxidoreductase [Falsiroseomonas sp.]|uniref:SDR family NAD(P)-dependent oxidoreductase n=1 Tax=Falsiroseomonas sp. TaxID=2870721 RepID=UPI003569755B
MPSQTRTIVIAGATSGIGLATALAFARSGAHLVLLARRAEALEDCARRCEAAGSPRAIAVPGDVADPAAMQELARRAIAETGRIDVWVNMAGVGAVGRFEEIPLEVHRRTIETNLIGALNGCHAALPHMLARDAGVIVNMGSIGSRVPVPFAPAYAASKWGVAGLTDSLRHEFRSRSRVQVCGVYPTVVDTPAVVHAANHSGRAFTGGPMLSPTHVAERILDLVARPRRALRIGLGHAAVPGFWLAPEAAGRAFGRVMRRGLDRGPRAPRTNGAVLAPMPDRPATTLGLRTRAQHRLAVTAIGAAVGLVALGGLLAGARRS